MQGFDAFAFLSSAADGTTSAQYAKGAVVFAQGEIADAVFFLRTGAVKLKVNSPRGKEAVIALLGPGDFFGEACLASDDVRNSTAVAMTESAVLRVQKDSMQRIIHSRPEFSEAFVTHLLSRNIRFEEDLVDQLFNSSEKRLARVLLLLAKAADQRGTHSIVPKVSQETLAEIVGTTRSRVSFFMNKFRRLGYITYNGTLEVHNSLLDVLHN